MGEDGQVVVVEDTMVADGGGSDNDDGDILWSEGINNSLPMMPRGRRPPNQLVLVIIYGVLFCSISLLRTRGVGAGCGGEDE